MAVTYERTGEVVIITIDRPERRNSVDLTTAELLRACWDQFDADEEALVGILTGTGGNFSAGADLKAFDLADDPTGFLGFTRTQVSKPTIAAVEGYCVAGGLEMALWCDLRVGAESSVYGCLERRFGVPLLDGGTQRLPLIVGRGRALDMILTGREVNSDEALAMGLINRRVPDGEALAASTALAASLVGFPQAAMRADRTALLEGVELRLDFERHNGVAVMAEGAKGAALFAAGLGRSGAQLD